MPVAIVLLLLLLGAVPATAAGAVVGISDQGAETWADARVRALGVQHARLVVPYDAAVTEPARVQAWLHAAAGAGLTPHVAFEHVRASACPSRLCVAPTREQYGRAVRTFLARFPSVRTFTTWNEANHQSQPVANRPEAVAGYYEELAGACPACTVVAGDVLDSGNYVGWLERFRAATSTEPRLWGLHNYGDVTYGRTTGTDAVLAAVPGDLWLEETGGIVTLRNTAGRITLATDEQRAAAAVRHGFALAKARPRITRMYVYHWRAGARDRFDAGLSRPDGSLRPSYFAMVDGIRSDAAVPTATTSVRATLRWTATWSKQRRLVLRATCTNGPCAARVTSKLRTKRSASTKWKATSLTSRRLTTTAAKRTIRMTLRVGRTTIKRARRAAQRQLKLSVTGTPTQMITLKLKKPR